jgi:hypothetical protein
LTDKSVVIGTSNAWRSMQAHGELTGTRPQNEAALTRLTNSVASWRSAAAWRLSSAAAARTWSAPCPDCFANALASAMPAEARAVRLAALSTLCASLPGFGSPSVSHRADVRLTAKRPRLTSSTSDVCLLTRSGRRQNQIQLAANFIPVSLGKLSKAISHARTVKDFKDVGRLATIVGKIPLLFL